MTELHDAQGFTAKKVASLHFRQVFLRANEKKVSFAKN